MLDLLRASRFDLSTETATQFDIGRTLATEGVPHRREARLSPRDRIDFLTADGLGIEVKIRGQRRPAVLRQLERYAEHDAVKALVLLTNVAVGFPATLNGKPLHVISMGRAWL